MGFVYLLPDLGEGIAEAEVVCWHVAEGARVAEDAPLVDLLTAKATVEATAPKGGAILKLLVAPGERVEVGAPLAVIGEPGEDVESLIRSRSSKRAAPPSINALPRVRKLAAELGVSLEAMNHTGTITEEDVRRFASRSARDAGVRERRPLRGLARATAEHLARAQRVPAVTVFEEATLDSLQPLQRALGLGPVPFLVQAAVAAFRDVPEANAILDEVAQELVLHERVDVAVAVHVGDDNLAVPVVRDCNRASLFELEERVRDVAKRAYANALKPAESAGGTFTVSCPGDVGALFAAPLLNVPQVGLLALHRTTRRAIVTDDGVAAGLVAHVSFTYDHRAIHGVAACRFLRRVVEHLSRPFRALESGIFRVGEAIGPAAHGAAPAPTPLVGELLALPASARADRMRALVETKLRKILSLTEPVDPGRTWMELGLTSLGAVLLRDALVPELGRFLSPALLFTYTTPGAFAEYLVAQLDRSTPSHARSPKEIVEGIRGMNESDARRFLIDCLPRDVEPPSRRPPAAKPVSAAAIDATLDAILQRF